MPFSKFKTPEKYRYQTGFGSYQESEAVEGALPIGQNTPQRPPFGLYTEKISGSAFQAPRPDNQQTWLYRIIPSAVHELFEPEVLQDGAEQATNYNAYNDLVHTPTQVRWDPFDIEEKADWVHSMRLLCAAGDVSTKSGLGYFIFTAGQSMDPTSAFSSTDGELLIILQTGVLDIKTELGHLLVRPLEICVIPRGIKYNVLLPEGPVRGYALELHQGVFTLPNLGPLGSFGCANTRDFQIPVAAYEEATEGVEYKIISKFNGRLYEARQDHSPFDIVAWHGTYYPYKYDLGRFMTVGSISYDHPDPSIFTLLASSEGVAELAIFPPRWLVMENTFRPPWYHRNTMAEFMGLIQGEYDARTDGGFQPGGASLHNVMVGHGPDSATHARASEMELLPQKVGEGSMAFVLEANVLLGLSQWAWSKSNKRQLNYNARTWLGLRSHFKKPEGAKVISPLLDQQLKPSGEVQAKVNGH
ncbi:homogentisate 1,2-dioxygenase [Cladophialophora bantiana CBS 173.52]|uniref:homogentisate 1,2-dioxygenase n=1 Tax=Cladophialophora bantiana (strain ATCC 10958 / CBS 173.52 / CDC B-1940 / NIH 8579) TaxID=1442370 RepID=A0A0D2EW94_CLAB1|nr:homogentisate 1,2-dioxygenase [Cladophialophora bantiana CBS 173.52]KIW94106.1 homogentisate 1,2-dioxygenase [Cladophialophora bantiana CBS 173.52]